MLGDDFCELKMDYLVQNRLDGLSAAFLDMHCRGAVPGGIS
jgi:hypothetical protein